MIPAAMIQFTRLPIALAQYLLRRHGRQRSRFALGQQIEHVVVEFFVDFAVQRGAGKVRHAAGGLNQHFSLRTVDDFSNCSAELVAAPRVRNRRHVAVGEQQHDRLVGFGIQEILCQHQLAVHRAVGGKRHVETHREEIFEHADTEIFIDSVDIGLVAAFPVRDVLRHSRGRRTVGSLALVFLVNSAGDFLDLRRIDNPLPLASLPINRQKGG